MFSWRASLHLSAATFHDLHDGRRWQCVVSCWLRSWSLLSGRRTAPTAAGGPTALPIAPAPMASGRGATGGWAMAGTAPTAITSAPTTAQCASAIATARLVSIASTTTASSTLGPTAIARVEHLTWPHRPSRSGDVRAAVAIRSYVRWHRPRARVAATKLHQGSRAGERCELLALRRAAEVEQDAFAQ